MKVLTFLLALFISSQVFAKSWVFDLGLGIGRGTFSHTSFEKDISVTQVQTTGAALYKLWPLLFVGLETRYQKIFQTTELEEAGSNIRGSMWSPANPVLLIPLSLFALRFSYQFFGDYKLENLSSDNEEIVWQKARGYRASVVLTNLLPFLGSYELFYQNQKFGQQQVGSSTGDFFVKPELVTYGVEYKIIF